MEQAVNTFNKGLVTDTNPLVQSTETMTDALNATFVTMDGDELVLQNDMGNRRVDNAYLPSGYQPVGMKEYGGIIYVAAYNPITNKSQIGSFPSPERKFGSTNNFSSGDLPHLLEQTTEQTWKDGSSIKWLNNDSELIPLTENFNIHIGDKFGLVRADGGRLKAFIENYSNIYNTNGEKVLSPKNKQFTLQFGVLNSENEFVDLTSSLARYNSESKIISGLQDKSDLYRFNEGSFLMESLGDNGQINTEDDQQFIEERQIKELNTYSYKLIGPLYAKLILNHVQDFQYSIFATNKNESDDKITLDLYVTSTIIYNCPDNCPDNSENSPTYKETNDSDYVSFEELEDVSMISLYKLFLYETKEIENSITKTFLSGSCTYNKETGLYTAIIKDKYSIILDRDTQILDYYICPKLYNRSIYLKDLSSEGFIDLNLVGTGLVRINSWSFKNIVSTNSDDEKYLNTTYFRYNLESYPEFEGQFRNLKLKLTNIQDSSDTFTFSLLDTINNTTTVNTLPSGLSFRKMYYGELTYDKYSEQEEENIQDIKITDVWLLTTALLNGKYDSGENFGTYQNLEILPKLNSIITKKDDPGDTNLATTSKLYDTSEGNKEFQYETFHHYKIKYNNSLNFDEYLLPDYVTLSFNVSQTLNLINSENINRNVGNSSIEDSAPIIEVYTPQWNIFTCKRIEKAISTTQTKTITINNAFSSLRNLILNDSDWFDQMVQIGTLNFVDSEHNAEAWFTKTENNKLIYPSQESFNLELFNFYINQRNSSKTYYSNTINNFENSLYREEGQNSYHSMELIDNEHRSNSHVDIRKEHFYSKFQSKVRNINKPFIFGYCSSNLQVKYSEEDSYNDIEKSKYRITWIKNKEDLIPVIDWKTNQDINQYFDPSEEYYSQETSLQNLQEIQKEKAKEDLVKNLEQYLPIELHYKYNKTPIEKSFFVWNPNDNKYDYICNQNIPLKLNQNINYLLFEESFETSSFYPKFAINDQTITSKEDIVTLTIGNSNEYIEFLNTFNEGPANQLTSFDIELNEFQDQNKNELQFNAIYNGNLSKKINIVGDNGISNSLLNVDYPYRLLLVNYSDAWDDSVRFREEGDYEHCLYFKGLPKLENFIYKINED